MDGRHTDGRRVAALAMAAAMAAPVPFVSVSVVRADDFTSGVVTVALADAQPASPAAALTNAQALYKAGKYEESLTALQAIKGDGLDDAGKKALADTTAQAQQATQMRRAARADFEMGQKALETGDSTTAANSFKNVVNNPYADEGTLAKAKEQSVLAGAGARGSDTDWKAMYESAVADFKTGNYDAAKPKFVALQQNGYKAPWFSRPPREYLEQIDKNAAGGSQEEQARAAYLTARDQYRKGDWIAARQNFTKAQSMGYKAGFFEDEPGKYLARMDKKEMADASTAARATMAAGPAPAVVVANSDAPLLERPAAVAPATPAGKPQPESVSTPAATPSSGPAADGPSGATVVAATGPTGETVPMTDADRLSANVRQLDAERNNKQFQARDLVASARAAEDSQRYAEARELYTRAADLDPNNVDAANGRSRMLSATGTGVQEDAGTVAERRILAERQSIIFSVNTSLASAQTQIGAKDFANAQISIEGAAAASRTNPSIFKPEENAAFAQQIADARRNLAAAQDADRVQKEQDARDTAQTEAVRRQNEQAVQKQNTIKQLIADSQRLTQQGRYEEALKVITQIQVLDPQNEYATGVKPILFDRAQLRIQRTNRENFENQFVQQMNDASAKTIPYSDILTYPADWPDLSSRRDQTLRDERQVSPTDEAVNMLLEKTLPEVRFDNVSFSDVIDFLRDTSQANIFVNWKALEGAGINRDAPVSTRLRNVKLSKVLKTILESVGGGATVQLNYTVDEGVITISTTEDLAKNVETRTYDIRDLIIQIPDYENVPNFQLQSSSGRTASSGQGGGGGGGSSSSSSGVFGGGGGGGGNGNNQNQATKEELVEQITTLIRETIGIGTWKEDGGSLGSLRELSGQLIVTQTPEVHRQITGLLQKLREQRSIQVMVEARFLTVQKNFLEDVGIDFDFYFNFDGNPFSGVIPGGTIGTNLTQLNSVNAGNVNGGAPTGAGGNVRSGATAQTVDPLTGNIIAATPGSVQTGVAPIGVVQNSSQFTQASGLITGVAGNLAGSFGSIGPSLTTQVNAFLDDFQASLFFRATQGNQNVTQLTAPRLTLFNGQTANILVATQTAYVSDLTPVVGTSAVGFDTTVDYLNSGVSLSVTATVSADRKYVTMNLEPQLSTVIGISTFPVFSSATTVNTGTATGTTTGTSAPTPVTNGSTYGFIQLPSIQVTQIHTSVSIPDGGTLLLGGTTVTGEIEREAGVPVLSKIPFLKRAFTNRSFAKDESILLVLVKPTIIIQREIEQQNFPLLTSGAR